MFKVGDAVIHPIRGAGVVVRVMERKWRGSKGVYYQIELMGQPDTKLMVPTDAVDSLGLRLAISPSKLGRVWSVLREDPEKLPSNHKKRYKVVDSKLHTGDIYQVAEVVRDMAWRQQKEGNLTTMGKRRYKEGMRILAGEIAAVAEVEMDDAKAQIQSKLTERLSSANLM
jgi:CarD family transcriptional regulator